MPELDSVDVSAKYPNPFGERFSPWGPCGPDLRSIVKGCGRLGICILLMHLRLAPGDADTGGAARQWSEIFGIGTSGDLLAFTNTRMGFVRGQERKPEGLDCITMAVNGKDRFEGILERASKEGLCGDGWINMCGVRWCFVDDREVKDKL